MNSTTTTPASVYKQLRGHLAELKLTGTADALPLALDQAQAEGWSLAHPLERLLAIEGCWATRMRFLAGSTLLVIDELGYLPLPAEAASALFQVINHCYMKTSIVITTNRPVGA
jgi:hypothetical protein